MGRNGAAAVRLVNGRTPEQWAEIIRGKWQDNVRSIFETATYLETAHEELGPALFNQMVRDQLKWSRGTISKLRAIADDCKLVDVSHGKLPASWGTLYQLTRLTQDEFDRGIESGIIHAGMERKDIALLKPPKEKPPKPEPAAPKEKPKSSRPPEEVLEDDVFLLVSSVVYELPAEKSLAVFDRLRLIIDQLEDTVKLNQANSSEGEVH